VRKASNAVLSHTYPEAVELEDLYKFGLELEQFLRLPIPAEMIAKNVDLATGCNGVGGQTT
jgi:hypothetical protein